MLQIWLICVSLSIVATEIIVGSMEVILLGKITSDYILTGLIASFFVASLITWMLIYFITQLKQQNNAQLETDSMSSEAQTLIDSPSPRIHTNAANAKWEIIIILAFSGLAILLITASVIAIDTTRNIRFKFEQAIDQTLPVINTLDQIVNLVKDELMIAENRQHPELKTPVFIEPEDHEKKINALNKAFKRYQFLVEFYFPHEQHILQNISEQLEHFNADVSRVSAGSPRQDYLVAIVTAKNLINDINQAISGEQQEFNLQYIEINNAVIKQNLLLLILCGMTVAFSIFGSLLLVRHQRTLELQVNKRTQQLSESLQRLEDSSNLTLKAYSLVQATLESTDNGILVVNSQGVTVLANKRFSEMWRIPPDLLDSRDDQRMLKHVLSQLVNPQDFLSKVEELYTHPEAVSRDTLLFRDGRVFARYSHPERLNDQVVGRVWSFLDITEQHNAEQQVEQLSQKIKWELERSENERGLLKSLLTAIPDLVWVKNTKGVYMICNPAFGKLMGAEPQNIVGKTDYDFFPAEVAVEFRTDDRTAELSSVPFVREEWVTYLNDGHRGLLETVKVALKNTDAHRSLKLTQDS